MNNKQILILVLNIIIAPLWLICCGTSSQITHLGSCNDIDTWQKCRDIYGPESDRPDAKHQCEFTETFDARKKCPAADAVGYCSQPWGRLPNYYVTAYYTSNRKKVTSADAEHSCLLGFKATFSQEDPRLKN